MTHCTTRGLFCHRPCARESTQRSSGRPAGQSRAQYTRATRARDGAVCLPAIAKGCLRRAASSAQSAEAPGPQPVSALVLVPLVGVFCQLLLQCPGRNREQCFIEARYIAQFTAIGDHRVSPEQLCIVTQDR